MARSSEYRGQTTGGTSLLGKCPMRRETILEWLSIFLVLSEYFGGRQSQRVRPLVCPARAACCLGLLWYAHATFFYEWYGMAIPTVATRERILTKSCL